MRNTQKWGFVACVLAFWAMGGTVTAGVEEGQQVFAEKKCITCHTLGDQKGAVAQLGGSLDHVGGKCDAAWLKAYLSDPKSKISDVKMPKPQLTEKELDDLAAYMSSLK